MIRGVEQSPRSRRPLSRCARLRTDGRSRQPYRLLLLTDDSAHALERVIES